MAISELSKFSLFQALDEQQLNPIVPLFSRRQYRRGQILFFEGEIGSNVYFVLSGQVKLSKILPNGEEQIIDWCGPYNSFAEMVLIESVSYPATAEVVKDSTVLVLNNEKIPDLLQNHPALAVSLIRTLSKRLRMSQEFIRILTSRTKAGVLAALLLRLAQPPEKPQLPIFVDATLTHRDLASMIGTSRECVNRAINTWKKAGIIRISNDKVDILKPHELAEWP